MCRLYNYYLQRNLKIRVQEVVLKLYKLQLENKIKILGIK